MASTPTRVASFAVLVPVLCLLVPARGRCDAALLTAISLNKYGIGQAINYLNGSLYFSMSSGMIVEFDPVALKVTWVGTLQAGGRLIESHPTGFAHAPGRPFLLGAKGRFIEIDWRRFRADGHLDRAIVREIHDPFTQSYSRGAYVEVDGRVYLASSDYRPERESVLRYYDAAMLAEPTSTSTQAMLAFTQPIGPWVQAVVSIGGTIALTRNKKEFHGWIVDYVEAERRTMRSFCLDRWSELEAFYEVAGRQFFLTGDTKVPNLYVRDVPAPQ